MLYSHLQRLDASFVISKVREFLVQKIVKIRKDHENAAAEAGYVIFRLLSSHRIAFQTRRISFEHHPFLGVMD